MNKIATSLVDETVESKALLRLARAVRAYLNHRQYVVVPTEYNTELRAALKEAEKVCK